MGEIPSHPWEICSQFAWKVVEHARVAALEDIERRSPVQLEAVVTLFGGTNRAGFEDENDRKGAG